MPAWWVEISWLPRNGEDPNGVGYCLMVKSQIRPAKLLMIPYNAMKPATFGQDRGLGERLEQQPFDQDTAGERQRQRQYEGAPIGHAPLHHLPRQEGREHRHFTLGEIQMVDRLVDHHDRERHTGIDRACGDAGQGLDW